MLFCVLPYSHPILYSLLYIKAYLCQWSILNLSRPSVSHPATYMYYLPPCLVAFPLCLNSDVCVAGDRADIPACLWLAGMTGKQTLPRTTQFLFILIDRKAEEEKKKVKNRKKKKREKKSVTGRRKNRDWW